MRIYLFCILKSKTDLGGILGKNFLENQIIRLANKFAKLITKTNSKMRKLKAYDKPIYNSIYKNRWRKAVDDEL